MTQAPEPHSDDPPPATTASVSLVHAGVKGRARLKVLGLYRSPRLKQRLEERLAQIKGVRTAEANPVTGRLLVLYTPSLSLQELVSQVDSLLDCDRPRTRRRAKRPMSRPGCSISDSLNRFGSLLRGFYAQPATSPVLGASADTAVLANDRAIQEIQPWHLLGLETVLERLGVSPDQGLSSDEAAQRPDPAGAGTAPGPR
jgi:hypothetical protein